MKKLLLFTFAIGMVACSKPDAPVETPKPKTCNCVKQTWLKGILQPNSAYYFNGGTEFYSNNCSDDGKIIPGSQGNGIIFEYRVKCN